MPRARSRYARRARSRTPSVSYFERIFRLRSSSIAMRASMLGPRPLIRLGSTRTARARSSSVSSRIEPYMSRCSNAPDTTSAGGAVGGGKLVGSYP